MLVAALEEAAELLRGAASICALKEHKNKAIRMGFMLSAEGGAEHRGERMGAGLTHSEAEGVETARLEDGIGECLNGNKGLAGAIVQAKEFEQAASGVRKIRHHGRAR